MCRLDYEKKQPVGAVHHRQPPQEHHSEGFPGPNRIERRSMLASREEEKPGMQD